MRTKKGLMKRIGTIILAAMVSFTTVALSSMEANASREMESTTVLMTIMETTMAGATGTMMTGMMTGMMMTIRGIITPERNIITLMSESMMQ